MGGRGRRLPLDADVGRAGDGERRRLLESGLLGIRLGVRRRGRHEARGWGRRLTLARLAGRRRGGELPGPQWLEARLFEFRLLSFRLLRFRRGGGRRGSFGLGD
jgi:hypothetical protein